MKDIGVAMTEAFDDQRRTDLCRLHGRPRAVVDLFGPTSRSCGAAMHTLCGGRWTSIGYTAPCLCPCHASTEMQRANLAAIVQAWGEGAASVEQPGAFSR